MKDPLNINIHGIKCDNPDCDYREDSVKVEEYKDWLNKPCPECGQNLLTVGDFKMVMFLLKMTKAVNKIFPKVEDDTPMTEASVHLNGNGISGMEIIENENK